MKVGIINSVPELRLQGLPQIFKHYSTVYFGRSRKCVSLRKHPLVKLADVIDWGEIERSFGAPFEATTGRPALPPRLVTGLLYLQHAYDCSDEAIVKTWIENPYVQYFTGETCFQTDAPTPNS